MRLRLALILSLLAGAGVLFIRPQTKTAADPLTGVWTGDWGPTPTHRNSVTVNLSWDGKTVTGAINPGPNALRFTKTSFDFRTGAVHLELDDLSTGRNIHYVVNGTVENGALIGTWNNESNKGNFRLIRK